MLGNSAAKAMSALALAASHAGGLAVNIGTMTKPYHVGMASRAGVMSARLAAAGATASHKMFEHPRGFLTAFSPTLEADWNSPSSLGKEWRMHSHRLCVKRYPTCYFMHRSFASTAAMLEGKDVSPDDVVSVTVTMGRGQTAVLVHERPWLTHEARFSEQFAMAAAVILGKMSVTELTDEVVQRPDIQAFLPKVKLNPIDEYDFAGPRAFHLRSSWIELKDGQVLDTGKVVKIPGHAFDPLTKGELWQKFCECTAKTHAPDAARALFDATQRLHELRSVAELPTTP